VQNLYGTATDTRLTDNGEQNVYAGGTANSTFVLAGGSQLDYGTADGTFVYGLQSVYGSASETTIESGGQQKVFANGTTTGTIIDQGASLVDWGTDSDATVGGDQYVFGVADSSTVSFGVQHVEAGGTANGVTIGAHGQQILDSSAAGIGTASNTTLNGGGQFVYGAATVDQTTIDNGGTEYLYGTATNTVINSGAQIVYANGTASGTTINGGTEHVLTGGTADGVTFGGSSGTLSLDQASTLGGSISGFQAGDTIDLGFVSFSSANTTLGYSSNATNTGGTLTVTDGTNTATMALLGLYTAANFALASDGNGGTFVTDPATTSQSALTLPAHS